MVISWSFQSLMPSTVQFDSSFQITTVFAFVHKRLQLHTVPKKSSGNWPWAKSTINITQTDTSDFEYTTICWLTFSNTHCLASALIIHNDSCRVCCTCAGVSLAIHTTDWRQRRLALILKTETSQVCHDGMTWPWQLSFRIRSLVTSFKPSNDKQEISQRDDCQFPCFLGCFIHG